MADQAPHDFEMPLGDHLEDLRRRIIYGLIGVAVCAGVMLSCGKQVVWFLCQPLFQALKAEELEPLIETLAPIEGFSVYLKVSLIVGGIIAMPWLIYQAWKFISVGMHRAEQRVVLALVPLSGTMTVLGLLFLYYLMLPICLWFLIAFTMGYPEAGDAGPPWITRLLRQPAPTATSPTDEHHQIIEPNQPKTAAGARLPLLTEDPDSPGDGEAWIKLPDKQIRVHIDGRTLAVALSPPTRSMLRPRFRISEYISFVTLLALGIVIAFQVPVVLLILGWTGLVDPRWLARYRGHCVFGCFALGMILTPADPISMVVLAVPLWGLYELGMLLMKIVYRRPAQEGPESA